jgi:hypothetical protein
MSDAEKVHVVVGASGVPAVRWCANSAAEGGGYGRSTAAAKPTYRPALRYWLETRETPSGCGRCAEGQEWSTTR